MEPASPKKTRFRWFKELLHHPTKLRIVVGLSMLIVWYAGYASPWSTEINEAQQKLSLERKRLALAMDVEKLRVDLNRFQDRLPKDSDSNEWIQYILAGLHGSPLKLILIDTENMKEIGPYKVAVVRLNVEGSFREIDDFIRWIESNERLFRIDDFRLQPATTGRGMSAVITVLGVMG